MVEGSKKIISILFQKKKNEMVQEIMRNKVQAWHEKGILNDISDYDIRIARLKKEILVKSYEESIMVVVVLDVNNQIDMIPTFQVYDLYEKLCNQCNILPMKKEYFSVFVKRFFDYEIIDKKLRGKKYRLFIKKQHFMEV